LFRSVSKVKTVFFIGTLGTTLYIKHLRYLFRSIRKVTLEHDLEQRQKQTQTTNK